MCGQYVRMLEAAAAAGLQDCYSWLAVAHALGSANLLTGCSWIAVDAGGEGNGQG